MRPGAWTATLPAAAGAVLLALAAPAAAGDDYDLRLAPSAQLDAGETRALSLTVAPRPGHTVSADGPLSVRLAVTPAEGLTLPRRRFQRRHAADPRAEAPRFDLRMRGDQPGSYALAVEIEFWVCAGKTCRPVADRREVAVTVQGERRAPPAKM